ERAPAPIFFGSDLRDRYGMMTARLEPEPNGRGGQHFADEWSIARRPGDANCLNTGQASDLKAFEPVLPPSGPCATSLLVQSDIEDNHMAALSFELVNVRELADAFDRHIGFLNGRGTHLPERSFTKILTRRPAPKAAAGRQGASGMPAALEALLRAQRNIFAAGDVAGAFS